MPLHHDGFRRRVCNITAGVIIIMNLLMILQKIDPILHSLVAPSSFDLADAFLTDEFEDDCFLPAKKFMEQLWARVIAIDEFSVDPTRKSEQYFWDTYRGREDDWYEEYRMSQSNFNGIVRDCVPYLYSRPTYSLKSARFRYIRGKVVMATLIRYLAIQSDQHALGKEFGVRQPCIGKRIERGCKAFL